MTEQLIIKEIKEKCRNRTRNPHQTDAEILSLLHENEAPMRFHEITKKLGYNSGKLQTAVKRLSKKGRICKKIVPNGTGRSVTMIFFEEFDSDIIIPIKMKDTTAKIIEMIPEVMDEFSNINDLFRVALVSYFKGISPDIKKKAIQKAVEKGFISNKKGDILLGR